MNVLVRARFEAAPGHTTARQRMQGASESGELVRVSRQVVREYLATVTCPQPWWPSVPMDTALEPVAALENRFEKLGDGPAVTDVLKQLCREVPVAGKQVHDANIVAAILAHGERRLLTFNGRDFRRYSARVELMGEDELQ